MPAPNQRKGKAPLRRTVELPAKLRTELQELGHLPAPGKGKLGRKERRKAAREAPKLNRAAAQNRKRKSQTDEPEEANISTTKQNVSANKKVKINPVLPRASTSAATLDDTDSAPVEEKKPKRTALEKLLAKQEKAKGGSAAVNTKRAKSKQEELEDQEIAYLEAKLGVRGGDPADKLKGKWKGEFQEDGLDDLFEGIGDIEAAAFSSASDKKYAQLLRQQRQDEGEDDDEEVDSEEGDDDEDDELLNELGDGIESDESEDSDDEIGLPHNENSLDSDEAAFGEDGISDDELINPSDDDDDDEEMSESCIEESDATDEEEDFSRIPQPGESDFDSEGFEGFDSDEGEAGEGMTMTFNDDDVIAPPQASTSTATPSTGRYVPPHLREKPSAVAPNPSASSATKSVEEAPEDPKLRRQIQGNLNKLSSSNMPAILEGLSNLYSANPRALVSTSLISLLLEIVSGRDNLGEQLVITYAALVAALSRTVGIELSAGVVAKCVTMFDAAREKNQIEGEEIGGFEGRPGSKECENLVGFLAELYNFQVISCVLIYDLVRLFIESGLHELEAELLVKIVKRCGQQLRQDDPSALKEIVNLVKNKLSGIDQSKMNSRTRFMIDVLTNLKNNKIKPDANGAVDNYSGLKKFLSGMKKRSGTAPEPLRLSLHDIRSSDTKGKWWLVGAAWAGDPLADESKLGAVQRKETKNDRALEKLARAQGMNTDIRKGVFIVLMSGEDYVDACERLLQLGLSEIQQREIARVLLQCAGNEKAYNPYYTLVAHRLASKSHGFQITLQYNLWDFMREMGEKSVGGQEMVKEIDQNDAADSLSTDKKFSERKIGHLAKLFAWCVAKQVLSIAILKPIPFANPKPATRSFLLQFFSYLFLSTQTNSPALIFTGALTTRKDREAVIAVFGKGKGQIVRGLAFWLEAEEETLCEGAKGESVGKFMSLSSREKNLISFGVKIAREELNSNYL